MLDVLARLDAIEKRLAQTEAKEVSNIYLPYSQRQTNPQAATGIHGDFGQPWPLYITAFYCSVFVNVLNNGANFWTIDLIDATAAVLASVNTSALAAGVRVRLSDFTITQPAATNANLGILATLTGGAGSILIGPAIAVLRQG